MVEKNVILTIDSGTQSIRAALIDDGGKIIDIVKTPIEPYFSARPGWAEQKPEYYWETLSSTCRKLLDEMDAPKSAIAGVAVTTQRATMVNVDKDGEPLRPAITWLDQRKAELRGWPSGALRFGMKAARALDTVEFAIRESESNWIRQNEPEIWKKTHKFIPLSCYYHFKLTGEFVDSTANTIGYLPFDYRNHEWARDSDFKWKMFPMERSVLHDLVAPGTIIGKITDEASRETGVPAGLPVVAAAADKACEVIACGCSSPETACLSFGTTATVMTSMKKYVEVVPLFPSYPGAVPGTFNTEVQIFRGFWMVSWFREEFGLQEQLASEKKNIQPEQLFDDLIKDVPPGSMGLTLQPYWTGGIKVPGPEAKGAIIGFGDVHTRAHLYRAILEGLAYSLKEGLARTEKKTGVQTTGIMVSGGGSQSGAAMQITADVFNLPARRPSTFETSALGAAIIAAVGLAIHPDFDTAVSKMTGVGETFEPIPQNVEIYDELFNNVYQKMYPRLRSLYNEIRRITGYPAR